MKRLISTIAILFFIGFFINWGGSGPAKTDREKQAGQQRGRKPETKKDQKKETDTEAVPVQVVNPYSGDISSFILFSSNIDSEKMVDIYPMTSGIIEKINHDEGDSVNKGDVLAILDD